MTEFTLENLEIKIDELIRSLQKVRLENKSLNKKISDLNNENVSLLEKQKESSDSIKKLILKLQDELTCQAQQ